MLILRGGKTYFTDKLVKVYEEMLIFSIMLQMEICS